MEVSNSDRFARGRMWPQATTLRAVVQMRQGGGHRSRDVESQMSGDMGPSSSLFTWRRLHILAAMTHSATCISEILAGFALYSMVQLSFHQPTVVNDPLLVLFSINTMLLMGVNVMAMAASHVLLPHLETTQRLVPKSTPPLFSPHEQLHLVIELIWGFSVVVGMVLFHFQVILRAWITFWDLTYAAPLATTLIIIPAIVIYVLFAAYFYRALFEQQQKLVSKSLRYIQQLKKLYPV